MNTRKTEDENPFCDEEYEDEPSDDTMFWAGEEIELVSELGQLLYVQGVTKGAPSLHLPVANDQHTGLYIFFADKGAKKPLRLNPAQDGWLKRNGWCGCGCDEYAISLCADWLDAARKIKSYLHEQYAKVRLH